MPKATEKDIIDTFRKKDLFTRDELFKYLKKIDSEVKETTLAWRIHDLKKKGIVKQLKRGTYTISSKPKYEPEIDDALFRIAKTINNQFKEIQYCLWDTKWINEFTRHQVFKSFIIIEVEREYVDTFYYHLTDTLKYKHKSFVSPNKKEMQLYIYESKSPIVIKKLITRSPISKCEHCKTQVYYPSLEKIFVDLFVEEELFNVYRSEMANIYLSILRNYTLNFTTLFGYAGRRDKANELRSYIWKVAEKNKLSSIQKVIENILEK